MTWRQKDRDFSEELGLYGKQTNDSIEDDLFLVGDNRIRKTQSLDCNENDNQSGKFFFANVVAS